MINHLRSLFGGQSAQSDSRLQTLKIAKPRRKARSDMSLHHPVPPKPKPQVIIRGSAVAILPPAELPPEPDPTPVEGAARDWIAGASSLHGTWHDHGTLHLFSGQIFFGDPTWGDDHHLRTAQKTPVDTLHLWIRSSNGGRAQIIWLQAQDARPEFKSDRIAFGVEGQAFAFGDFDAGSALSEMRERNDVTDFADGCALIQSHLQAGSNAAKWITVPPEERPVFLVPTGKDAALTAVWCHSADGTFAGILIDVAGSRADGSFLDTCLPNKS